MYQGMDDGLGVGGRGGGACGSTQNYPGNSFGKPLIWKIKKNFFKLYAVWNKKKKTLYHNNSLENDKTGENFS